MGRLQSNEIVGSLDTNSKFEDASQDDFKVIQLKLGDFNDYGKTRFRIGMFDKGDGKRTN